MTPVDLPPSRSASPASCRDRRPHATMPDHPPRLPPLSFRPSSEPAVHNSSVYSAHRDFFGGIPFFSLSVPSLLPSLPSISLRSRPPCGQGVWGSGGARPPNVFWCILGLNCHPFDCLITFSLFNLIYCPLKESFHDVIYHGNFLCNSLSWPKTRFRAYNLATVWGNSKFFFGGGDFSPKDAWNKQ